MTNEPSFFRARADAERANADAATLTQVRDRCTRAARAWEEMAEKSERIEQMRAEREAAKVTEPAT